MMPTPYEEALEASVLAADNPPPPPPETPPPETPPEPAPAETQAAEPVVETPPVEAPPPEAPPPPEPPPPPPVPLEEQKVKITVYGQEREVSVADLKRVAQKAEAAEKYLERAALAEQEAKRQTQAARNFIDHVAQKPYAAVVDMLTTRFGSRVAAEKVAGDLFREGAMQVLNEEAQEQQFPGSRAARLERQELEERRASEAARQAHEQTAAAERQKTAAMAREVQLVDTALEESGLPVDAYVRGLVAKAMLHGSRNGNPLTHAQAVSIVKQELPGIVGKLAGVLPVEDVARVAPKLAEAVRKSDLAAVKEKLKASPTKGNTADPNRDPTKPTRREPEKRFGSVREYREWQAQQPLV